MTMSRNDRDKSWIIRRGLVPQLSPCCQRLLCAPHAGGGASIYKHWQTRMPAGVEVCRLQLPGHEERIAEPAISDMDELMDQLVPIVASWSDMPLTLFGHSMGALIGYELARRLEALEQPVRQLIVAGMRPPDMRPYMPVHELDDSAFAAGLRERGGTPKAVLEHDELMEMLKPMLRADFRLAERYVPRAPEPLRCPILALAGQQDSSASRDDMGGWQAYSLQPLRMFDFPGGHFFVQSEQRRVIDTVARELGATATPDRDLMGVSSLG